ncbi:hypothetical protein [Natrinema soli]|uniref:Uncharacterized protein n=1 Tax=Natrinema soli TaxID=1930624 RepID=A0ABD5SPJ3_9EURY|nr:hypothetical protein [Natrinema soli]
MAGSRFHCSSTVGEIPAHVLLAARNRTQETGEPLEADVDDHAELATALEK